MGYYSYYTLSVKGDFKPDDFDNIVSFLKEKELIGYSLDKPEMVNNIMFFDFYEECTWYDAQEDIYALASAFPHLTFLLSATGETVDGCWEYYLHGSESELCQAEIPRPKTIKW